MYGCLKQFRFIKIAHLKSNGIPKNGNSKNRTNFLDIVSDTDEINCHVADSNTATASFSRLFKIILLYF